VGAADDLVPGEDLVLRLHPHGKTMLGPAAILAVILAVVIVVILFLPQKVSHLWEIRVAIGAVALVAAVVWFGVPFLRWRTTVYEVTTKRLRLREGIVTRAGRDFPLSRISDVSFSQGLVDRLLGCGKLIVESPSEHGQLVLTEIPQVTRVQGVLFEMVGNEAARTGRPDWQPPDGF
jgi:uncharacterized membrane protein YdbT with pleckstrin-like domain